MNELTHYNKWLELRKQLFNIDVDYKKLRPAFCIIAVPLPSRLNAYLELMLIFFTSLSINILYKPVSYSFNSCIYIYTNICEAIGNHLWFGLCEFLRQMKAALYVSVIGYILTQQMITEMSDIHECGAASTC